MQKHSLKYFLAANSANGFVSEFLSNCDKEYKSYIIKGGPGTGKSSFMKKVAAVAENKGYNVTLCPCSSDPKSLDAVIIEDKKIILLDGTAPHTVDPVYPGVCQEILNFGQFWDSEKLNNKNEIIRITDQNKALHKTASRYILAAGDLLFDNLKTTDCCTDKKRIKKFTEKLALKLIPKINTVPKETVRFLSGITPDGFISYNETVTDNFKNIFIINDESFAVASLIMNDIRNYALKNGYEIITLKNSFFPNLIDHIIIPTLSLAFVTENRFITFDCDNRRIHSRRFIDMRLLHNSKNRIKFNTKTANELLNSAYYTLNEAKSVHDELEKHYINAMDFKKLNNFADMFCNSYI